MESGEALIYDLCRLVALDTAHKTVAMAGAGDPVAQADQYESEMLRQLREYGALTEPAPLLADDDVTG